MQGRSHGGEWRDPEHSTFIYTKHVQFLQKAGIKNIEYAKYSG
jgi:hypothetical protein